MIIDSRYTAFFHSLQRENTPFLRRLEQEALAGYVPIIRKDMQSFLKWLLAVIRPEKILEVGAATGFSSIFMAEYAPEPVQITTIENYEKRIPVARENIRKAGKEDCITLLAGDAADILPSLTGPYDLIFMDAAKGQYLHFLDLLLPLMKSGTVMVTDNVLQDGDIIESRFAVTRRDRTIHKRMREFLFRITHMEELQTAVLPVGDGIAVSCRK